MAATHPIAMPEWRALAAHHEQIADRHLRDLFAEDPGRGESLVAEAGDLYLDYSKNRVTPETMELLVELASGSRRRAAPGRHVRRRAHQRHRGPSRAPRGAPGPSGRAHRGRRRERRPARPRGARPHGRLRRQVRDGSWTGHTGERIRTVVNLGIGGSDLGPAMAYRALRAVADGPECRFVSNVDGADFLDETRDLDPAETLFIVASKTFTTHRDHDQRADRQGVAGRRPRARTRR